MAIITPAFTLLEKDGNVEIRSFWPYISAEATVGIRNFTKAASRGSSSLACFIFGGNNTSRKISMIAVSHFKRILPA